jgi:dUTP pyrophosphatase
MKLRVSRVPRDDGYEVPLPARQTPGAAGFDLYYAGPQERAIWPNSNALISTGVRVAIPDGYVGLIRDRSSLAMRGLAVTAGVIDSDYRGEIRVLITNLSEHGTDARQKILRPGHRIAQLLVVPVAAPKVVLVDELDDTERGASGFGSTGEK